MSKKVLVCSELRQGDAIYQLRYIPKLMKSGRELFMAVNPSLHRLIQYNWPEVTVLPEKASRQGYDTILQLNGLDLRFGVERSAGYLTAPSMPVQGESKPVVCFNWLSLGGDRRLTDSQAREILAHDVVTWVNLNPQGKDFQHPNLLNLGGEVEDFWDTARYLMGCDWVLTTDTSIAHLSGALGRKTCVIQTTTLASFWEQANDRSRTYESVQFVTLEMVPHLLS